MTFPRFSHFPRIFRKRNAAPVIRQINVDDISDNNVVGGPIFTTSVLRKTNVHFVEYLNKLRQEYYFISYRKLTDVTCAETLARVIFDGKTDPRQAPRQEVTRDNLEDFIAVESKGLFNIENKKAYNSLEIIRLIFLRALKGGLRKELENPANLATLNPAGGLALKPFMISAHIAAAVDWITRSSSGIRNNTQPDVRADLRELMQKIIDNEEDLFDVTTIDKIDGVTGYKIQLDRPAYTVLQSGTPFGGVVLGRFLQRNVIYRAGFLKKDAKINPAVWQDIACLMMIGHIRAQPYPDGNHRVASTLYACILLQNGRPFIAPNHDWVLRTRMTPITDAVLNNGNW
ncbi:MAG: hypothetical protein ACI92O_000386 [Colwellia sp.]|jgi:hypothetical protein